MGWVVRDVGHAKGLTLDGRKDTWNGVGLQGDACEEVIEGDPLVDS
jgi:hypothetical protein